jgi:MscS family membrane protein
MFLRALLWASLLVLSCALVVAQAPAPAKKKKKSAANPVAAVVPAPAPAPAAPEPPPPPPPDPLGRGTPRGTVLNFLRAAEAGDKTRAAMFLDVQKTDPHAQELVVQLKALIDSGTDSDLNSLSRQPEGDMKDDLPPNQEKVGVVTTPAGKLEVLLDRIDRPNEQSIWLFSPQTLRGVPVAYESVQHQDPSHYFPEWMRRVTFLSQPLWRWAMSLLALAIVMLVARVITRIFLWILNRSMRGRVTQAMETLVRRLNAPIFWVTVSAVERVGSAYTITALSRSRWQAIAFLTAMFGIGWLLIRLTDIIEAYARHWYTMRLEIEHVTFVGLLSRLFKILLSVVLVLIVLARAGVDVSSLITGLGIGGVAIAFAAQKTLSDLFGGISIVMRGALRVGDFCTVAGRQGTVEEIGISSMRMRTLDRTVVTIPNSKVAETDLENFTMRDQFWLHQVFTLRFDTSAATMKRVLDRMVGVLNAHPDIDPNSARARLIQLTNAGPQIEIFAYYRKPGSDFAFFLGEQEAIILEMMRVVEEEGTAMVAPVGVVQMQGSATKASGARG